MSSNLRWRPAKPPQGTSLPTEFKFALRKRFGDPVHAIQEHGRVEVKEMW